MSDSFRDLIAWRKGMALVTDIYRATASFPASEKYGLAGQLCRAAVAIPSDIAEGKGRVSKKEFVQMLAKARGSSYELQTQLEIAHNLGFLSPDAFAGLESQAAEVGRLLNGLITKIRARIRDDEESNASRPLTPNT